MATDAFGRTLALGDDVLPLFKVRHIDSALRSVAVHGKRHNLTTGDEAELAEASRLGKALAGGGFPLGIFGSDDATNPATAVEVAHYPPTGSYPTSTYRIPIPIDCSLVSVAIRAATFDGSPTEWDLDIYDGGVLAATLNFTPGTWPSPTKTVEVLGSPLSLSAGDELHFALKGSGLNGMITTIVPWMEATA